MPTLHVFVYPKGYTPNRASKFHTEREIGRNMPANVIGEVVTEALCEAYKAEYDPLDRPEFCVVLKFR